jgi:hypothetical protein
MTPRIRHVILSHPMKTPPHIRRALYGPLCLFALLNVALAAVFFVLVARAALPPGGVVSYSALALTGGYLAFALYIGWRVGRVRPAGWPKAAPR